MKKVVIEVVEEVIKFHELVVEIPDDKSLQEVYNEIRDVEKIADIKYKTKEHYVMEDFSDIEVFDVDNFEWFINHSFLFVELWYNEYIKWIKTHFY